MKKSLIAVLAAVIAALTLSLGSSVLPTASADNNPVVQAVAPASADAAVMPPLAKKAWGTSVKHSSDDSGLTRDIHVVCNDGRHLYLKPGQGTFLSSTTSCGYSGVDRIVVAYNQTVYCKNSVPPYQNTYFYTGTNYMGSNQTWTCFDQKPL